jgi:hypothetical protein
VVAFIMHGLESDDMYSNGGSDSINIDDVDVEGK